MTNKRYFLLVGILVVVGMVSFSCSIRDGNYPSTISALLPTAEVSVTPSITPSPTLLPTFTTLLPLSLAPINSTALPYPTATMIQANAVAFIATDLENNSSLWIANIDGSGERKLVDNIGIWSDENNFFLRWSPDGRWISYISNGELWANSPNGSDKRKILPAADKSKRLISYNWAPDGLQVAYVQAILQDDKIYSEEVKILNLDTGEMYELSSHEPPPYGTIIRWSLNGQYLVFNEGTSFIVFDTVDRKVKKEILTDNAGCSSKDNTGPHWSPNGESFFHSHGANGYANFWICVSGLDGSTYSIDVDGSTSLPVWDKTGNFLYFVARKIDTGGAPDPDIDQRLMRYDIRTQKMERILSLGGQTYQYVWSVSISPDGCTLETHTAISENEQSYVLMDLESMSTTEFTFDFSGVWAADSQSLVYLSHSNGYATFHKLDIQTHETTIFSGEHLMKSWAVSPVATFP